jgi:hypothetical protein
MYVYIYTYMYGNVDTHIHVQALQTLGLGMRLTQKHDGVYIASLIPGRSADMSKEVCGILVCMYVCMYVCIQSCMYSCMCVCRQIQTNAGRYRRDRHRQTRIDTV